MAGEPGVSLDDAADHCVEGFCEDAGFVASTFDTFDRRRFIVAERSHHSGQLAQGARQVGDGPLGQRDAGNDCDQRHDGGGPEAVEHSFS